MKKYEEYRESGVEWIGEIPKHWEVRKLKWFTRIVNGATPSSSNLNYWDGEIIWITPKDINNIKFIADSERKITSSGYNNCGTELVEKGSIILTTRAPIGKLCINSTAVCTNQGCKSLVIKQIEITNYLYNFLLINSEKLKSLGTGTTFMELSTLSLKEFKICFPPLQEQKAIADFLDDKCAKVDALVSVKEQQIALLKERRQAVIHQAVTKGLDSNVERKDSGIEWIGDIPKHWEVKRLKYVFRILKRIAGDLGNDVLSITQTGIKIKDISSGEGQLAMDYSKYQFAFKGDFAMNHMDLLTGWVDISKFNGVISPDYRVFNLLCKEHNSLYFLNLLQDCYRSKIFYMHGQGVSMLGRWRFPTQNFNNFYFPIPPIAEQQAIVTYLEAQTTKIDQAIVQKQEQILKLKEYKQSLINEVVTGKVKVS